MFMRDWIKMQIKIEELANSKIINFYPVQNIAMTEKLAMADKTSAPANDLLRNIAEIDGVERCLAATDILSVKHSVEDTADIKALVMAELDDFLTAGEPLSAEKKFSDKEYAEAVADALIRPTLNRDNGDIEIHSAENGIVELSFTGHCAGCPYAQNTLQNVVTRTFLKYMPHLREVKLKG